MSGSRRGFPSWQALLRTGSPSGIRHSNSLRPSAGLLFTPGLSAVVLWASTSLLLTAAETNGLPELPTSSLKPPRGEIQLSFGEQYGVWLVLAAVVVLAGIGLIVWLATRTKPAPPVPWAVQARQELESLRGKPEDGVLLSRTSHLVRHSIAAAFVLPAGELTTSEFCRTVRDCENIGPDLSREIVDFLRESDLRKFAPQPPEQPLGAVARAEKIIEQGESRLAGLNRVATGSTTNSDRPAVPKAAGQA